LEHPNIVRVLDVGQLSDTTPFLLMEYANGLELDVWLEGSGSMPPKRGLNVLRQLACAVDYLHAQGMVHGDIKPSNIIMDGRARDFIKLVDFGIATRDAKRGARRGVVGTPAYMAPEQARGEVCGPAIDVYGVAALALELFTGRPPYDFKTPQDVLTAVLTMPPAVPSERGLTMPGLDEVFQRGLHQDPTQRFAIASDFVDALERVVLAAEAQPARESQRCPAPVAAQRPNGIPVPARARAARARLSTFRQRKITLECRSWLNRLAMRLMAGWYALSS
jgi:serine/threonine-protein kinase